jgi:hypothetical protein
MHAKNLSDPGHCLFAGAGLVIGLQIVSGNDEGVHHDDRQPPGFFVFIDFIR